MLQMIIRMHRIKRQLLLIAVAFVVVECSTCKRATKVGDLTFEPYIFETQEGQTINATVGHLIVPERWQNPGTAMIKLAFVRLPSTSQTPDPPIFYLAGGPGVAGIENATGSRWPVIAALRQIADVVLLDQRGTGLSQPKLSCNQTLDYPLNQPATREALLESFKRQARICAHEQRQTVDLGAYNTEESAHDVNALREALGVQKISLVGSSYGTTLALTVIRQYGEHVHRAILVGVEAPDQTLKLPENGQKQLLKLADVCRNDPALASSIPDLVGMLTTVGERLRRQPVTVAVTDAGTKQEHSITVGEFDLKLMTALSIGYDAGIKEFPRALYSMSEGDYSSLGAWALRFRTQHAHVVQAAMDCASGVSAERWKRIQDEEKNTFLGREFDFPFPDICEAWGVNPLDPPYRSDIKSDVNTLFIGGTLDGRTPLSNAEEIKKGFSKSTMLIVEGASHGDSLFVGSHRITDVLLDFLKGNSISDTRIILPH